ncbi:ATP-binding protein [Helicovermis profundi]|uniref:Histidine kinase/HSP90-like ATPase domain-containing protein n=1 Tax=Helicovermis profundi TaxID=3065157 RepID=A0AAU9EP06_9FIRM|nr:hypothetical protein HLPR_21950 [Clostridia bacterium S502]
MIIYKTDFLSTFKRVDIIVNEIIESLKSIQELNSENTLFMIGFMLRELLNNAVEHGNKNDESKYVFCEIDYDYPYLSFKVEDEGKGVITLKREFDFEDILRERNRGMELILKYGFVVNVDGNKIHAIYELNNNKDRGVSND